VRVLVLGGSGFLGSQFGFSIDQRGWEGVSLSRREPRGYAGWEFLHNPNDLARMLDGEEWDVILNCVAMASHEACEENPGQAHFVNSVLPGNWAEECRRRGVRFVHISTDAVFSGMSSEPYREESPATPTSQYGLTKREGELRVLDAFPEALVIRTNFFGWSETGTTGILDFFYGNLRAGIPTVGFTDYVTSSIYSGDLADILWTCVERQVSGILHISSSTPLSKFDFGRAVAESFSLDTSLISPGSKESAPLAVSRGSFLALNNERAEVTVGAPLSTTLSGIERAREERSVHLAHFAKRPEKRTKREIR
jgi:dTDP-4-dehydrorhamnose reductase